MPRFRRKEWVTTVILTVVSPNFLKHPVSINSYVLGQHFSLLGTLQITNVVPCLRSLVLLKIPVNYNKRKHNNQPNPIKLLTSFCACYLLGPLCLFWQQSFALKGKNIPSVELWGCKMLLKRKIFVSLVCMRGWKTQRCLHWKWIISISLMANCAQIVSSRTQRADPIGAYVII